MDDFKIIHNKLIISDFNFSEFLWNQKDSLYFIINNKLEIFFS